MKVTKRERREIDYLVEIDGKTYNLEDLLEDLNGAAGEDVRFYQGDVHSDLMLQVGALTSLGGREYPCTLGPQFESFRMAIRKLLREAEAAHLEVELSQWTQGYVTGRRASEGIPYTAEQHITDVMAVADRINQEFPRRDAYEARREAQPEEERDPPYRAPKSLVSDFWKVAVSVPRCRLPSTVLDGSGMGDISLEEMRDRLTAEIAQTSTGWSWP